MEVVDYLQLARRRLRIIVAVPLLAAVGVLAHAQFAATSYQAGAYVFAPQALAGAGNQFSGPAGVTEWVNEFSAAAVSPRVVRRVARTSGVPAQAIAQGLQVTQQQQSGQLLDTFSSTEPGAATKVVKQDALATSEALFRPPVRLASRALAHAQASLQAATQRTLRATTSWGRTRPDLQYAGRLRALTGLEQVRASIRRGDGVDRAAADAQVARVRAQVAALQRDVMEFQNLRAQSSAATTVLAQAQKDEQLARAQYADAVGAATVLPTRPAQGSSSLVKGVLSAVVAGLFIALCLVAALELFGTARRTARDVSWRRTRAGHGAGSLHQTGEEVAPAREPGQADSALTARPDMVEIGSAHGHEAG